MEYRKSLKPQGAALEKQTRSSNFTYIMNFQNPVLSHLVYEKEMHAKVWGRQREEIKAKSQAE